MMEKIDISKITTYQAGVYQAKAFRHFREVKNSILKKFNLTMMQWVTLGVIKDEGRQGIRTSDLAKNLDTTQAFITGVVNALEAKRYVKRLQNREDARSTQVIFLQNNSKKMQEIEKELRKELKKEVYKDISREDLTTYITVLSKFASK